MGDQGVSTKGGRSVAHTVFNEAESVSYNSSQCSCVALLCTLTSIEPVEKRNIIDNTRGRAPVADLRDWRIM